MSVLMRWNATTKNIPSRFSSNVLSFHLDAHATRVHKYIYLLDHFLMLCSLPAGFLTMDNNAVAKNPNTFKVHSF